MATHRFAMTSALLICLSAFFLTSVLAQPTATEEPSQRDLRLAEGTWTIDSVYMRGKKLDRDSRKDLVSNMKLYQLSIKGNRVEMVLNDDGYKFSHNMNMISANMTINPSVYPKTCDVVLDKWTYRDGHLNDQDLSKHEPYLCIYEINDKELVFCFSLSAKGERRRPTNLGKNINDLEEDVIKFVFHKP